jgi:peroxiredoxin
MRSSPPRLLRRRLRALFAVLCMAALALLAGCSGGKDRVDQLSNTQYRYVSATPKGQVIALADRKDAGNVTGKLLDGSSFSMADHAGDVVFINFWGSWCGPCVIETPELDKIYRANQARGVLFVGVAVKDVEDSTQSFVDNNHISYPIVFDFNAQAALQLGNIPMRGLPATVVLDKHGRVAAVFVGAILAGDIDPVIETLIAES